MVREVRDEIIDVMEGLTNPLRTLGFSLREMRAIGAFNQKSDMI